MRAFRLHSWTPLILLALLLVPGAARADGLDAFKGQKGKIDIAGGTAHIPVMTEAAKRIAAVNPDVAITVAGGGSGVGVQKVGEGLVEIGNTGRALSEEEIAKYGLKTFPFAIDGVAVVINPANPAADLTEAQIKDVFAGKIANWKELGGKDAAIHVYTRDEASGTREVFWEKMLGKGTITEAANVTASNGAMKTAVAGDPGAVGYVSIGHIDQTVKAPTLSGVAPTQENAMSGTYKVTRKLYMNTKGEPKGLTEAFIAYINGPEGAEIIKASGYIPLR